MTGGEPERLAAVLERSRALGFLGPRPVEPQIEHARLFWSALSDGWPAAAAGLVADLGAGAGCPRCRC